MSSTLFVVLSFEGPDKYSRVGGLATRVTGLTRNLARKGFESHLFFIGDPKLPGHEVQEEGLLHLHRWCQWLSQHYLAGAYEGEAQKLQDWNRSLPGWLMSQVVLPAVRAGRPVVIIGEEWQSADALIAIHAASVAAGVAGGVHLMWNANNVYGFERINWTALNAAAKITTVSRYMKYVMEDEGIVPRVIPNGMEDEWLNPPDQAAVRHLQQALRGRVAITKIARWDAEKRWDYAVDAIAQLKELGDRPVLFARGGAPSAGGTVLRLIQDRGLTYNRVQWTEQGTGPLVDALLPALDADVVLLESHLVEEQSKVLYEASDAVLANSSLEPFGLVGLEAMAAGGIAAVGLTGEDYMTSGYDAISLQSDDVMELVHHIHQLRRYPAVDQAMRRAAKVSAKRFTWGSVIDRTLFQYLRELGVDPFPARLPVPPPSRLAAPSHKTVEKPRPAARPGPSNRSPSPFSLQPRRPLVVPQVA